MLFAPFISAREVVAEKVGTFLGQMVSKMFDNQALISNVSCPVLFIHGYKDRVISY